MEEAARDILRAALAEPTRRRANLAAAIRRRFEPSGGVEIAVPPRETLRAREGARAGLIRSPRRRG
jgi:antitoxin FitA